MKLFWQSHLRLIVLATIFIVCHQLAAAHSSVSFSRVQDIAGGSEIFAFVRPAAKKPAAAKNKPSYNRKRTRRRAERIPTQTVAAQKPVVKLPTTATAKPSPKPPTITTAETAVSESWEQLGVTYWRLMPVAEKSGANDGATARILTQDDDGTSQSYAPQRVAANTEFKLGDKVRLSFESPRKGFLYVIDREIYADGTYGEPYLVFPTRAALGGDSRVEAGRVIDLPGQSDRIPFFTLKSNDARWRGEMLTIIVAPEPLAEINLPNKPSPISAGLVATLEEKYLKDADEYEQENTAGTGYTKAEQEAGGIGKRQLTQDDPFPQTVYRAKVRPNEPLLINLNLSVK